jgi:dethiobiotin synthetase
MSTARGPRFGRRCKRPPDVAMLLVTGTGTGVGKTVVTAALAVLWRARGMRVAAVKPVQTGLGAGEPGDLDDIRRLAGVEECHEWSRYPDPLAPLTAARRAGQSPLSRRDLMSRLLRIEADLVLVEGAGGLLVRYDETYTTLADLASDLPAEVVVVVRAGLGTLNETALTLEALEGRAIGIAGVVIGCWPEQPGLAERCNVADLEEVCGRPLSGVLPAGAGALDATGFAVTARAGLGPELGGEFHAADFRRRWEIA